MKPYLLAFLIFLCLSAKFDITSTSTCTTVSGGICTLWTQVGTVTEQTAACFPAQTQVMTQNGRTKMSDLKVGDQILTIPSKCDSDCQPYFTQVTGWLHKDKTITLPYLEVFTGDSSFITSPFHNIGTSGWQYYFGKDLQGKSLIGLNQRDESVSQFDTVSQIGAFSPITRSNNYLIFKQGSEEMVLAHCYSHISNPVFYEPIVDTIIKGYDVIWGQNDENIIIHPAAQWMMRNFPAWTQGTQSK